MIDAAMLLIVVMFSLYAIACAVECGVALALLNDQTSRSRRYFTPLWEITNVFLVFGFTGLAYLFSGAVSQLSQALTSILAIALVAFLVRATLVLSIFYLADKEISKSFVGLFAICCFAIPLSFTAAGAYLFTGQQFWHSFTGWLVMASAVLGILSLGLLSINQSRRQAALLSNELIFAAWMLVVGSALPLSTIIAMPHMQKWPLLTLSFLSIIGLFMALLALTTKPKIKLWKIAAMVSLTTPLLLALANRPYLIAGELKLSDAYSAAPYINTFVIGSLIIAPLIVLGFWLFWKLIRMPD